MSIEKTLERLEKLYEHYTRDVELLTAKKARIQAALDEAQLHMVQTFDAIQALKGKPSLDKMVGSLAEGLGASAAEHVKERMVQQLEDAEITQNGNPPEGLPPAEPGMKWVKNEANEDVLVPINAPKPLVVPGVTFSGEEDFTLPVVQEDGGFDSPESFLS